MQEFPDLPDSFRKTLSTKVVLMTLKLSIDDLKWVVMMVIGNSAESAVPSQWIESIVFYDDNPTLQ